MKINDSQFGFRKNRRTTDALYIILSTSLIANKNKTPIYLAFVDLAKAFDSINHNLLWLKLSAMGISTKMLKLLQHMYRTARSVVSYDGFTSSEFPCHKGVRQGCPLSPLLFSLFISDLEHELLANSSGKVRIGEQEVRVIMFADDLVLLAETSAGLQQSLSALYHYCHSWQLTINADKSKVMIFSKTSRTYSTSNLTFFVGERKIEIVSSIKYLGLVLTSNGSMSSAISTLANQARKALINLIKKTTYLHYPPPYLMCKCFDALITPILEHGSQIWDFQSRRLSEIEIIHRKFCKFILNVPSSATNAGVYGKKTNVPKEKPIDSKILAIYTSSNIV